MADYTSEEKLKVIKKIENQVVEFYSELTDLERAILYQYMNAQHCNLVWCTGKKNEPLTKLTTPRTSKAKWEVRLAP